MFIKNNGHHKGFTKALGRALHYTSMEIAPYDTGNLADSIILTKNHWRSIQVKYSLMDAHYLYHVEFGKKGNMTPRQKANVGFIRFRTVNAYLSAIQNFFENDNIPFASTESKSHLFMEMTQRKGYSPRNAPGRTYIFGFDYHKYYVGQSRYGVPIDNTRTQRRLKSRYYYSRSSGGGNKSRE